jgi:hypothetical protein
METVRKGASTIRMAILSHHPHSLEVVQRAWVTISFDTSLMDHTINFIRSHSHTKSLPSFVQDFSTHFAGMAQSIFGIQLFGGVDTDVVVVSLITSLRLRDSGRMVGIIRTANSWRD